MEEPSSEPWSPSSQTSIYFGRLYFLILPPARTELVWPLSPARMSFTDTPTLSCYLHPNCHRHTLLSLFKPYNKHWEREAPCPGGTSMKTENLYKEKMLQLEEDRDGGFHSGSWVFPRKLSFPLLLFRNRSVYWLDSISKLKFQCDEAEMEIWAESHFRMTQVPYPCQFLPQCVHARMRFTNAF